MSVFEEAFTLLDSYIAQHMRATNTPGVAVALTDHRDLLHTATYGLADVAARVAITPETLFEIGSIGKSFTAIAILQLHEAGQVDLHAPVTRFLPWFRVQSPYEPIALHHLLSHTGGIIMGTEFSTEARYEVWALRETEACAPPGTFFHYSNVGYKALGLVLEQVLDRGYSEIIRERILVPLGMRASEAAITHETRKRLAVGYETLYDDRPAPPKPRLVPATWLETNTADGSIAAPVIDMAAYVQMLLSRGRGGRQHILSERGFRLMTEPVIALPEGDGEPGSCYAYGLDVRKEDGNTIIGHDGGTPGYVASILADLDDRLGVAVLTNGREETQEIARFALTLLRAARRGQSLPPLCPSPEPTRIENAFEYAGTYWAGTKALPLESESERLILRYAGERIALEQRGKDRFYVPHPDLCRFLLRFGRDGSRVVEAFHGPDWYVNRPDAAPPAFKPHPEWSAYPGHYRSHNPWHTNFRVVLRKGDLVLSEPDGDEEALVALEEGVFRIGTDERGPERLRFGPILNGEALRANLSGCDYYRTFTP